MLDKSLEQSKEAQSISDDPVLAKTVEQLQRMRYFRRQYDQRRAWFYRQYLGQRDQRYFPDNATPRANTFVMYPYSNVETTVARVDDAFFSMEEFFECKPRTSADDHPAENMGLVLMDRLKKSNFKSAFEGLNRNINIYGHAGIKVDWDWDYDIVTYAQPIPAIDPKTGQPLMQLVQTPMGPTQQPVILGYQPAQKAVPRNRPKFTVIDVYDLLIDPDGGIVSQLTEKTLAELLREQDMSTQAAMEDPTGAKQPLYDQQAVDLLAERVRVAEPKDPMGVLIRLAEVWDNSAQTQTIITFGEDSEAVAWKDLRASYRATSYSPYKRKVYAGEPVKLYHGRNQFAHGRIPILHTSFVKIPNEVYGLGNIEVISDLAEALNTFVNMITDNWNLGINRRYAYDMAMDIDHQSLNAFNTPGGKVAVSGDPNKVIAPLPFFTPQAGDYMILDVYKNTIEMASGISDFYGKGVGAPTNNKTATGIQSTIQEANYRFKLYIRNLEVDILQPLLQMCASMIQQYLPDQIEVQITGDPMGPAIPKFIALSPEDLIGNFEFQLVGPNYATNRTIKQRTMLEFTQLLGGSPYINQYESIRELAKLFEIRNIDRLLYTPQQVQQMQQAQQAQQIEMMIFEHMLDTEGKARLQQSKPLPSGGGQGKGGGPKTYKVQPVKGAGLEGAIRNFAQAHGARAQGLDGLKEG